ncbi:MAG TPA: hypothetical protein VHP83_01110 [Aggregatilineaceae bacterium]|nr:hypothetical protein [Aggregatilineaceae bacterium]
MARKYQGPNPERHSQPRIKAISATYQNVEMRSLLEVHFAEQLDQHEIAWKYEPERIGAGHYLVDFYLPELRCWVEVKGRFEFRDDLLLPNVAINLHRDRGERLFLYMEDQAFSVGFKDFKPLTHDEFWAAIKEG